MARSSSSSGKQSIVCAKSGSVILPGRSAPPAGMGDFGTRFDSTLAKLLSRGSMAEARQQVHQGRFDSILKKLVEEDPEAKLKLDSAFKKAGHAAVLRADSFSASAGLAMARQLEHIYSEVLRESYPAQNAFALFPMDTSVPPGAKTHTVRRIYQDGEAGFYEGGEEVPRVGISQQEETFAVKHIVTSFNYSLFEQLSTAFANIALVAELLRTARDIIMEFANRVFWYGDTSVKLYGILNYPWLPVKVVSTPFDGSADADDVLGEINAVANFPKEESKATMSPNTFVTSPRARNYLMTTPRGATTDTTIGEFWLRTNGLGITKIEEAWELQGAGPGGTDGMLFYRRDRLGVCLVVPQGFTTLPVQSLGFEDTTFAYMSVGGAIMRDVGNNILAWVDMEA